MIYYTSHFSITHDLKYIFYYASVVLLTRCRPDIVVVVVTVHVVIPVYPNDIV